jgi:hypothetical protein
MAFPKHHGITLAQNSWIENANFEQLSADPVPVSAGRVWFNTTDKRFKHSSLDAGGAVVIRTFANLEELNAAVSTLNTAISDEATARTTAINTVVSNYTAADSALGLRIDALGSAFNYVGTIAGGADAANAFDMSTLIPSHKDAGDYFKVITTGYFKASTEATPFFAKVGDGLVWNLVGAIDIIDNTDSEVNGTTDFITVTGSTDTGFVVDVATTLKTRVTTLETGLADEITDRSEADTALDGRITTVEGQVSGKIGDLTTLTTTEKGTIVGAINEVDSDLNSEINRATGVEGALQTELDTTQTGAGLSATGTYVVQTSANYISTATSLTVADTQLDAALKVEETARIAVATNLTNEVTRATTAEGNLQTELDTTQTGAGLSATGTYVIQTGANYISTATSLTVADTQLDAALKVEETARIAVATALSDEVTRATTAEGAIKTAINGQHYATTTAGTGLSHTITHSLNSEHLLINILVEGADGKWRNDIVPVEEINFNSFRVDLAEARRIKVSVKSMTSLA